MPTAYASVAAETSYAAADGTVMKKNNIKGKTRRIAMASMLCALSVVVLALGSIISALDLTMVAIASIFVFFAVIEMGSPYQYLIYGVTSLLSLLLLPDKYSAFLYFIFGGVYPILKRIFERLKTILGWILKALYFNAVLAAMIFGAKYLFGVDEEELTIALFVMGNAAFFLYDIAMTKLITFYLAILRKKLKIEKYFKK